jgi:hypothetical protein
MEGAQKLKLGNDYPGAREKDIGHTHFRYKYNKGGVICSQMRSNHCIAIPELSSTTRIEMEKGREFF